MAEKEIVADDSRILRLAIAAFVVVAVVSVVAAFLMGILVLFYPLSGPDAGAKTMAGMIALVGGSTGSVISLLGLILKRSADQRELRLKGEAEQRLRNEAAIKAVGLLSTSSGELAPMAQRSGVILTLAELDSEPLALSLAHTMLQREELSAEGATWLYHKVLTSKNRVCAQQAALATNLFAERMLTENGDFIFPAALLDLEQFVKLDESVQYYGAYALVNLILLRPFGKWSYPKFWLLFEALYNIWNDAKKGSEIKTQTGIALRGFLCIYSSEATLWFTTGLDKPQVQTTAKKVREQLIEFRVESLAEPLPNGRLRKEAMSRFIESAIESARRDLKEDETRAYIQEIETHAADMGIDVKAKPIHPMTGKSLVQ